MVANYASTRLQPTAQAWSKDHMFGLWNHHYAITKDHDIITSVLHSILSHDLSVFFYDHSVYENKHHKH